MRLEDEPVFTYLNSLYHTIVLKDVVNRHQVREPAQLDGITRILFDNCGNITTAKRMTDYMKAQGLSVSLSRAELPLIPGRGVPGIPLPAVRPEGHAPPGALRQVLHTVSVGRFRDNEIDFVAERQTERLYVQVCYSLSNEDTVEREYRSLRRIPDNHPKLVLSLDTAQPANRGGIRWQNLVDFLLDEVTPG